MTLDVKKFIKEHKHMHIDDIIDQLCDNNIDYSTIISALYKPARSSLEDSNLEDISLAIKYKPNVTYEKIGEALLKGTNSNYQEVACALFDCERAELNEEHKKYNSLTELAKFLQKNGASYSTIFSAFCRLEDYGDDGQLGAIRHEDIVDTLREIGASYVDIVKVLKENFKITRDYSKVSRTTLHMTELTNLVLISGASNYTEVLEALHEGTGLSYKTLEKNAFTKSFNKDQQLICQRP